MPRALLALTLLLLAAPAVRGQDMPIFTFVPEGSRWEPTGGEPPAANGGPVPPFTVEGGVFPRATAGVRSPDGGTLYVGLADGRAVWAFTLGADGRLSNRAPYCPLRVRYGRPGVPVTGLAVDRVGRVYAATPDGVQVFDPTGRLSGVIPLPADGPTGTVGVDGDRLTLSVGDKVYSRRLINAGK